MIRHLISKKAVNSNKSNFTVLEVTAKKLQFASQYGCKPVHLQSDGIALTPDENGCITNRSPIINSTALELLEE